MRNMSHDSLHFKAGAASAFVAELLIHRLRVGLRSAAAAAHERSTATAAQWRLPPPRAPQPPTVGLLCFHFDRQGFEDATEGWRYLGKRQGEGARARTIARERGQWVAASLLPVPRILPASHGWRLEEFDTRSRTPFKPGIVSCEPNATLALELSLPAGRRSNRLVLVIQHTFSARLHGSARVSCAGGCRCDPKTLSAHSALWQTTTTSARMPMNASGGSRTCELRLRNGRIGAATAIQVADEQRSEGDRDEAQAAGQAEHTKRCPTKFKLAGLIVEAPRHAPHRVLESFG
jgi:hypothetical protein